MLTPAEFRELFLLDPAVVFLNHGSFGAVPRPVFEEQERLRARAFEAALWDGYRIEVPVERHRQPYRRPAVGAGVHDRRRLSCPRRGTGGEILAAS